MKKKKKKKKKKKVLLPARTRRLEGARPPLPPILGLCCRCPATVKELGQRDAETGPT
jgi:hypothetical protein